MDNAQDPAAGMFPPPDADEELVADQPDPAFGEIADDDTEVPLEGEPRLEAIA